MIKLDTPVKFIKGVGPRKGAALNDMGVETAFDLVQFYPRKYENRGEICTVHELLQIREPRNITMIGSVKFISPDDTKPIAILNDINGDHFVAMWPRNGKRVHKALYGKGVKRLAIHGKYPSRINSSYGCPALAFPEFEIMDGKKAPVNMGREVPVYTSNSRLESVGLGLAGMRRAIHNALEGLGKDMPLILPEWLRKKRSLMDSRVATRAIHFPKSHAEKVKAVKYLKYEELLVLQTKLALRRRERRLKSVNKFGSKTTLLDKFSKAIPFEPTGAQNRVVAEMRGDLMSGWQMYRLVQGDVGSGKTLVAMMGMLMAVDNGYQAAMMAPTEILAEQHFEEAQRMLEHIGVRVAFLCGGQKASERRKILEGIKSGLYHIVVGTHAVIQSKVEFKKLGLAVVDEQHRFGVAQRERLMKKGETVHLLMMTATPIPRSLALTVYGDLDVSIIDEMPKGRKPIDTRVFLENQRNTLRDIICQEIDKGHQAYVVYPLVEDNEDLDLVAATTGYDTMMEDYPEYEIGIVHGRMKSDEKDAVMRRFKNGEIQILVSTTVIEVGVNVPNATLMIIEHPERFGLSQLHQLRGRVGRGLSDSMCILMGGTSGSKIARARLQCMEDTTDGFVISEWDLKLRGEGEIWGTRQSGTPTLKLADLSVDGVLLDHAREDADELLERDADLKTVQGHDFTNLQTA